MREGIPYVRGLLFEGSYDRAGRLIILSGYGRIPLLRENSRLAMMVASRFMQVSEEVHMMRQVLLASSGRRLKLDFTAQTSLASATH